MTTTATTNAPEATTETHGVTIEQIRALAHQYHVPLALSSLKNMAGDSETFPPDKAKALEEYVKQVAMGMYPTLAKQIAAGIPTGYLLDPYRQTYREIFGPEAPEPDFHTDPRFSAALTGGFDPSTQRPAPMTDQQWQQHLRSEPTLGWLNTPQGRVQTQKVMDAIHQGFQ